MKKLFVLTVCLAIFVSGEIRNSLNSNEFPGTWTVWNGNKSEYHGKLNNCPARTTAIFILQVLKSKRRFREEFTRIYKTPAYSRRETSSTDLTTLITDGYPKRIGLIKQNSACHQKH